MGMAVGGSSGRGGRGHRRRGRHHALMSEINVTPFVDVMLVLLIIFMVAAPLLTAGVPLDLPKSEASALNVDKQPVTVSIKADGAIYIGESKIAPEDVVPKLTAIAAQLQGFEERIFVRGDKTANYGLIMQVMGRISGAGFKKVALITEQEK